MKKTILSFFTSSFFVFHLSAQEVGYNTTDIGAEFNNYAGGNIFNLHVAFNSKLHHSFIIRAGYQSVNEKYNSTLLNENGGGLMCGLGYRYYFTYKPTRLFMGVKFDYWKLDIDWNNTGTNGNINGSSIVPAIEAGYMFNFNDRFFLTPAITAGTIANSTNASAQMKNGFLFTAGLSAGVKF